MSSLIPRKTYGHNMNGFPRRSRFSRIVFWPWVWLLLTIFGACCPVDASARESLCRVDEFLSASTGTSALVAPAVKAPPAKDPLPAPTQPASLAGTDVLPPVCSCRTRLADTPTLLHPFATDPAPSLPRPPPSVS